jgi:multidrug efflux pump
MNAFIDAVIGRSRTMMIAFVAILFAGVGAYFSIPKESEPDVAFPYIYVQIFLEGVSPEDAERLLVRPMEQELRDVPGMKEMVSSAGENSASVTLEFDPTVDVAQALIDVRERVDLAKAKLPADADEPRVFEVKFSKFDPMMVLLLNGEAPERVLQSVAVKLKEKIEGTSGVMEVNIVGSREELLEITIDPLTMESYDLSPADVLNFVDRNNRLIAAGALQNDKGRFAVKVPGIIETPEDVLNLPIKVESGEVVHFRDIATVKRTYKDRESQARLNGQTAVALEIVARNGDNMLNTAIAVREIVTASSPYWPPGVEATFTRDKSYYIERNISNLMNNVATAIVLVFIVLIGILGLQNALLVGLSIPGSFCAAFIMLNATGQTINMVVLFALIIAVGMLVDGAIVVTELADRKMAEGEHRKTAYATAAKRMAWPIIASTATTLAAFLPLVFWPGLTGSFLKFLPITLIFVLTASLAMALLFVPTMGAIFGKAGLFNEQIRRDLIAAESGDMSQISGWGGKYLRFLDSSLDHPTKILGIITMLLIAIYWAYGAFGQGVNMFPYVEPNNGSIDIRARGDLSAQEKDDLVRLVEERVYGVDGIEHLYVKSGKMARGSAPDMIGAIRLNFSNWRMRRPAKDIAAEIVERTKDIAGIIVEVRLEGMAPNTGKPIDIEVAASDMSVLRDTAALIREELETIPGVINAEDTRPLPGIEWQLQVNRAEAAKFNADVTLVGSIIQLVTNGIKVAEYRPNDADEEMDIRVRFPANERSLKRLGELRIPTGSGNVPISTFVTYEPQDATRTIMRTDRKRTLLVQSDLEDGVLLAPVLEEMQRRIDALNLDTDQVQLRFKGGARDEAETMTFLGQAFGMALVLMAIILVTQFNSIFQSFLILTAVVFSTGGVLLGLLMTNQVFSLVNCGIGAIALAGIVVNNNIVLIDTFNSVKRECSDMKEAIMRTCAQRLRPVMLTTVTTILGLLPMSIALNVDLINRDIYFGGPSTQWWQQMASTIVGGLFFATILTLLLTPSLLMIQANVSEYFRNRRSKKNAAASGSTATA